MSGEPRKATVETLAAEVRVMMVGSRQVTHGVYDQLDWVDEYEIEPMGRVNPRNADAHRVYVTGRSIVDGALVRSWRETREWELTYKAIRDVATRTGRHALWREWGDIEYELGKQFNRPARVAELKARTEELRPEVEYLQHMSKPISQRWLREAKEWQALPLIVLAGLR